MGGGDVDESYTLNQHKIKVCAFSGWGRQSVSLSFSATHELIIENREFIRIATNGGNEPP